MKIPFNPEEGLIIIPARIAGPGQTVVFRLALDTGATSTMVSTAVLRLAGYDPALSPERVRVTTGSGIEYVPRLGVERLEAMGQKRSDFPLLSHTLPPTASVDGVLGLDFLRGRSLTIDFRTGMVGLA